MSSTDSELSEGRRVRKRSETEFGQIDSKFELADIAAEIQDSKRKKIPSYKIQTGSADLASKLNLDFSVQGADLMSYNDVGDGNNGDYAEDDSEDEEGKPIVHNNENLIHYDTSETISKAPRKSRRKPAAEICGRARWTEDMVITSTFTPFY